jgi:hypothetical protein
VNIKHPIITAMSVVVGIAVFALYWHDHHSMFGMKLFEFFLQTLMFGVGIAGCIGVLFGFGCLGLIHLFSPRAKVCDDE